MKMAKGSKLDLALKRKERGLTADKTLGSDSQLTQSRSGASSRWSMASGKQNAKRRTRLTRLIRRSAQRLGRMCGVCGKRRSPWQPFQQGKDTRVPISNPEQAVTKQDKSFVFQSGQSELVGKANGVGRGRTGGNVPRVVLRRGSEARKIRELRNENSDKT